MNFSIRAVLVLALAAVEIPAAPPLSGFPFTDESLAYNVNWPSGLSLGEGHLRARRAGQNWNLELSLDAGIPGFDVKDTYSSIASPEFCTVEFTRESLHGSRKTSETETVENGTVTRTTQKGGGKSTFSAPGCVKDALTLLYYARRELGQGRMPPVQQVLFGVLYQARLEYTGPQTIKVGEKPVQSDRVVGYLQGVSSNLQFEMYFDRDPARTPLLFRVPLAIGRFSMELVR